MTCQEAQHLLHAYLDGELDLVRNLEMEEHLQTCPSCAEAVAKHRTIQGAFRSGSFYFKARREESLLAEEFGERFTAHMQRTGMFLPRFS